MPGVSCAHYTGGGIDNQGCKGLFEAIAMYAHENTNCEFFARDDCRGVGAVRDAETCVNNLEMLETSGTERIRSFKCVSDWLLELMIGTLLISVIGQHRVKGKSRIEQGL